MIVYCCPNCKSVDLGNENDNKICMNCNTEMLALGVTSTEWNQLDNDQMKSMILNRIKEHENSASLKQPDWDLDNDNQRSNSCGPVPESFSYKLDALYVAWQISGDELSSIDRIALICMMSIDAREEYSFLMSSDIVKADASLISAILARDFLKDILKESELDQLKSQIITALRVLYDISASNAIKLYDNRESSLIKLITNESYESFLNQVLDVLEQEFSLKEFVYIEDSMPVYISDALVRFDRFNECSSFLRYTNSAIKQEVSKGENIQENVEDRWGDGIPQYSKEDLMTANDTQEISVKAVYDYMIKEGYDIEALYSEKGKIPSIVAKKAGELFFVIVDSAVAPTIPELDSNRTHKYIDHASKFHAKLLYASVSIGSHDAERFEKGLALRNDGYYVRFTGFQPIVYYENEKPLQQTDSCTAPQATMNLGGDKIDVEVNANSDTNEVLKEELGKYGLVNPKNYLDGSDGSEVYEGATFALGEQTEWSINIRGWLKSENLADAAKIPEFMMSEMWNVIGFGMLCAKEESSQPFELSDKQMNVYPKKFGRMFYEKKCHSYALEEYDEATKKNMMRKISDVMVKAYNSALEVKGPDGNAVFLVNEYAQTSFFEAFFLAGWNIYSFKHKKGFFSKLFGG